MDTEFLWISMIANIIGHSSELIKKLDISQDEFLRCTSYAAKSSLNRRGKDFDRFTPEKINEIFKNELIRRKEEFFGGQKETSSSNAQTPYEDLLGWAKQQEKFAESLMMAIDTFILFSKKYPKSVIDEIVNLALYNEVVVNEEYFLAENQKIEDECKKDLASLGVVLDTSSNSEEDPLQVQKELLNKDKQKWFKVDYTCNAGLTYQFQYLKYLKEFSKESYRFKPIFDVINEKRKNAFIVMTGRGFIALKSHLDSILTVLRENEWGKEFLADNEELKFLIPEPGIYQLYYDGFSTETFSACCKLLEKQKDTSDYYGSWPGYKPPAPIEDETRCIDFYVSELKETHPDLFLLLFVSDESEIQHLSEYMDPTLYQETIFAYLSQITSKDDPQSDPDDTSLYICFNNAFNATYNYALKINKEDYS